MTVIGLRELRQRASEFVRRVQGGETVTITVSGRPAALMVPAGPRSWRCFDDLAELFAGPPDPAWARDRDVVDGAATDPWERT